MLLLGHWWQMVLKSPGSGYMLSVVLAAQQGCLQIADHYKRLLNISNVFETFKTCFEDLKRVLNISNVRV